MAKKNNTPKATNIIIEGKYLLAAKECASRDNNFRIICTLHIAYDAEGNFRVESTDSYKACRIERGKLGKEVTEFALNAAELCGLAKAKDLVEFAPDFERNVCKVRIGKTEFALNITEGKYPNLDQLMPTSKPPLACYRYAEPLNANHLATCCKVVERAFGKGIAVTFATLENTQFKPVLGYADEDGVSLRLLLMPVNYNEETSCLAKPVPREGAAEENEKLRKELDAANANVEMWRAKALKLEAEAEKKEEPVKETKPKTTKPKTAKKPAPKPKAEPEIVVERAKIEITEEGVKAVPVKADAAEAPKPPKPSKRKAPAPAPKPSKPKPETAKETAKVAKVAETVTLETIRAWADKHGKRVVAHEGYTVKVFGVAKDEKELGNELKSMGFRWKAAKQMWWHPYPAAK